ncbi:MAG: carboxylating nicotinate-nucleotide diphosphorylase [Parvibaculales bacterium]
MSCAPLSSVEIGRLVADALAEDLGKNGDVTSQAIISPQHRAKAVLRARDGGVLAGLDFAQTAFLANDDALALVAHKQDGDTIAVGDDILTLEGKALTILGGERVALNFIGHLSGIASQTAKLVALIAHTQARIRDTRKTLPNLRSAQKYAVRMGGGYNHRFGLDDAILIKDNHIAVAGSIASAFAAARKNAHKLPIEIEVDTLDQLDEALLAGADIVLLDNMPPAMLAKAVKRAKGGVITEASGRISAQNVVAIAETGVDFISIGALTHSAHVLDFGLDIDID